MIEPLNITTSPTESLTLADLQRMVRTTIEGRFAEPLWVSAEISELKLNRSGHCYLNLVEKGSKNGTPEAEARAVIWRSAYQRLATLFEELSGTRLAAGIRVLVRVVVTFHEVYGFMLQIIDLDPAYTLGEVERRRRETIAQLQRDGVWDMNRECEMPRPALRIAIVSSATAAGYQDFMREVARTPYRFRFTLFESLMQGDSAEKSIIASLVAIAEREEEFDAAVIIRGGGSTSDLGIFDSYLVASYVAQFPLPIVSGIGHDKDVSIVDMVAHTACKTPTAVATHLVELVDGEMALIDDLAQRLRDGVARRMANEKLRLERSTADLRNLATVKLTRENLRLDALDEGIIGEARALIAREKQRLDAATDTAEARSPERLLRLGFAVLRSAERSLRSVTQLSEGDTVQIEMADGSASAEIKRIITR